MFEFMKRSARGSWLIGHRGAMGHAPENTLSSFKLARAMGAELVECDVHLSRDRRCVVMHDEAVERTTNGHGLIRDLDWARIRKLDAGSWFSRKFKGEKVRTLDELLAWASKERSLRGLPMGVVIEIKNEPVRYRGIEESVIRCVRKAGMSARVILISFDHGVIKRAKRLAPEIAGGLLYNRPMEDPLRRALETRADALFPRRHMVTRTLVQKARKAELFIGTWTVNEVPEMKKLSGFGVDGIASNYPDLLNRVLNGGLRSGK